MIISGLQKLTLLDFPGHVACTVFFAGCDMRCPFCHNAPLVTEIGSDDGTMTDEEFFKFLKKRVGILDGVAITGGEPLLRADIKDFIKKVRELGYAVKLDTNGLHPERLAELIDCGLLDYVAMDIKNSPEKYSMTAGVPVCMDKIKKSIDILISSGIDHEFRTTVVKPLHEKDDFQKIGELIRGAKRYYLQQFLDSGDLIGDPAKLSAYGKDEMEAFRLATSLPFAELRGVKE